MPKPPRKSTPSSIELQVLDRSRRRCTLCFHLSGDLNEQLGQIAHLDDDPSNCAEDNLAFMCLPHHSLYDSKTKQHKNYTMKEAKIARSRLYQAIADGVHITGGSPSKSQAMGVAADLKTLEHIVKLMTSAIEFLRTNNFAGWSFDWSRLDGIQEFLHQTGPEHEFLEAELEQLRKQFREVSGNFMEYTATNVYPVGTGDRSSVPEELEYTQPDRFHKTVKKIHDHANATCVAYDELVRAARRRAVA